MKIKVHRYIILPLVILIYAMVIAWMNRDGFISPTSRPTYIAIAAAEIILVAALFIFLKKKEALKRRRERK